MRVRVQPVPVTLPACVCASAWKFSQTGSHIKQRLSVVRVMPVAGASANSADEFGAV